MQRVLQLELFAESADQIAALMRGISVGCASLRGRVFGG
jgi:hypothetical protein